MSKSIAEHRMTTYSKSILSYGILCHIINQYKGILVNHLSNHLQNLFIFGGFFSLNGVKILFLPAIGQFGSNGRNKD